jgi:hypothetical protein
VKSKETLIASQELRHQDNAGTWHVVDEGERVPRDSFLVAVHPGMFFVDTDELVALQTLTNIDAEGNPRTVAKGETLAPDDPFIDLHPGMVGRPTYEFKEEES